MHLPPPTGSPLQLAPGEVHSWCVNLDLAPEASAHLQATLSPEERDRSSRLRSERQRRRFIAAHGALRDILARYVRTQPGRISFVRSKYGKPKLGPEFGSRLKFNLSHSAGRALIGIAADANIGVDLELLRPQAEHAEIAQRFFSAAEAEQLLSLPDHLFTKAFLSCWTRKEAYLKACGSGLAAMPLDSFSIPAADPGFGPVDVDLASCKIAQATGCWSLFSFQPAPGYIAAMAVEGSCWRLSHGPWR